MDVQQDQHSAQTPIGQHKRLHDFPANLLSALKAGDDRHFVRQALGELQRGTIRFQRDNVIVAEIFYKYKPIAPGLMFDESVIYRRAFFKPRLGALTNQPGDVPCILTVPS